MTGDLVNLNKARKAKARRDARAEASAHRVKFGRTAAQRAAEALDQDRTGRRLDGHLRDAPVDRAADPAALPAGEDKD